MIGSPRRTERVGALRVRLIASILIASLLPFFAAWWIANGYVADQARSNADLRLTFSARSAAREATALLATTRARALELARTPKLQRAARRGDRPAVARLLGPGEAVYISRDVVHASYTLGDSDAKLSVMLSPTAGEGGYELVDVAGEEPWASLREQ